MSSAHEELALRLTEAIQQNPRPTLLEQVQEATATWVLSRVVEDGVVFIEATLPHRDFTEQEAATADKVREALTWATLNEGPPVELTGHLDLLMQKRWWKSADGPIEVATMETSHIERVIALLQRRAPELHFQYFSTYLHNAPDDVVDDDLRDTDEEWLEEMPLIKRMRKTLRKRAKSL